MAGTAKGILAICFLSLLGMAGCLPQDSTPEITGKVTFRKIPALMPAPLPETGSKYSKGSARHEWQPLAADNRWRAIVIHHSATDSGNVASINFEHKYRNGWDGIGYDFVIGNGNGSGNGEVESTFRWRDQLTGAHCGGTPDNWANRYGIGICLIGDFSKTTPSSRQMDSLVKLVRYLQQRYNIPTSRIYGHGTTPGGHATECPGKRFPMGRLKSML